MYEEGNDDKKRGGGIRMLDMEKSHITILQSAVFDRSATPPQCIGNLSNPISSSSACYVSPLLLRFWHSESTDYSPQENAALLFINCPNDVY
mmetsp:Transcript_39379/g.63853  ORF Transcript_39379/g.63853 Transcript_39379/m.63853 type:complete len:92 (+) Transcript_39379:519-794(+)